MSIPRYVGDYSSPFKLLVFTDASKVFYDTVIYIQDCVRKGTAFIMSKNHLIRTLITRSIPVLELIVLRFGVEETNRLKLEVTKVFLPNFYSRNRGVYCLYYRAKMVII